METARLTKVLAKSAMTETYGTLMAVTCSVRKKTCFIVQVSKHQCTFSPSLEDIFQASVLRE